MAGTLKELIGTSGGTASGGSLIANGAASIANGIGNLVNSTNLDFSVNARLSAKCSGGAPVQGTTTSLYLVPVPDGNAGSVDTPTPYFSPNYLAGNFYWPSSGTIGPFTMDIPAIPLEAMDYVPYLVNNFGQSISSGQWWLAFHGTENQY
jgi:hypothetical protein